MFIVGMGNPRSPALSDIPDTDVNHTGIPIGCETKLKKLQFFSELKGFYVNIVNG